MDVPLFRPLMIDVADEQAVTMNESRHPFRLVVLTTFLVLMNLLLCIYAAFITVNFRTALDRANWIRLDNKALLYLESRGGIVRDYLEADAPWYDLTRPVIAFSLDLSDAGFDVKIQEAFLSTRSINMLSLESISLDDTAIHTLTQYDGEIYELNLQGTNLDNDMLKTLVSTAKGISTVLCGDTRVDDEFIDRISQQYPHISILNY